MSAVRICGLDLKPNFAIAVVLDAEIGTSASLVDCTVKKIPLDDPYSCEQLRSFKSVLDSFLRDNHIDKVVVRKRKETGPFAASGTSFKIEAVVQLNDVSPVVFVAPSTIKALLKRVSLPRPKNLLGYQQDAYEAALTFIVGRTQR